MKKKLLVILATLSLATTLVACTGDEMAEGNTEPESTVSTIVEEVVPTETPTPTPEVTEPPVMETPVVEATPTPVPPKEGEFAAKAPMRLANTYDDDIVGLVGKDLTNWWASMSAACITFPSTKDISEERCEEILSENEFSEYMKDYCDIWDNESDSWSVSQTDFEFHHDYFQNIARKGQDDMHYFLVESNAFRYGEGLCVDEERVLYDEETDTLYLYLLYDYDYEAYVKQSNKDLAATLDEVTCSNRMILALEFDHADRLPVKEIVLVKPTGMERVSYGENEGKCAEIPSKVMSKLDTEEYVDFLGNHLLSYDEYEKFCTKYGVKKLYDNTTHKYAVITGTQSGKYGKFAIEKIMYDDELLYVSVLSPGTDIESNKEFGYIVVIPCFDYTNSVSTVINF